MKNINILVIDDSAVFREIIREIMTKLGCSVTVEETGKAGLEKLKQGQFSLICAGYHLADMSGVEFCGQVRGLAKYEYTSLILLTAEDNTATLKQAMLAGATDIFSKSDIAQLEVYVQRLVKKETRKIMGRVLFVEDSPVLQAMIIDVLTDMGLDVDAFTRAEEAWDAYQQGGYDLVLTDIVLEGAMSGVTLVRKIRRLGGEAGDIPIIAASGFDNSSRRIELFQLGINDYIAKPIIQEELVERIYNQLRTSHLMTELHAQQRSLYSLSMLDELTQLFNRHSLREFSGLYLSDVNRNDNPLSLAVLDIDYFNKINEVHGRDKGDQVLVELGEWLKRIVREGDMVARWGSDEFVFLLANCKEKHAISLMTRVSKQLKQLKPAGISISMSIGVVTMVSGEKHSLGALFDLADQALYQAKLAGRDCVKVYEE